MTYDKKHYENNREAYLKRSKEWRQNNKKHISEYVKKWRADNPNKSSLYSKKNYEKVKTTFKDRFKRAKNLAKKRDLNWAITLEEYTMIVSTPCDYCEGKLGCVSIGSGIDRINNDYGYIFENCISCCKTCNRIKGDDLTAKETHVAVKSILDLRNCE